MMTPSALMRQLRQLLHRELSQQIVTRLPVGERGRQLLDSFQVDQVIQNAMQTGFVSIEEVAENATGMMSEYLGIDQLPGNIARRAQLQAQAFLNNGVHSLLANVQNQQLVQAIAGGVAQRGSQIAQQFVQSGLNLLLHNVETLISSGIASAIRFVSNSVSDMLTPEEGGLLWYAGPDDYKTRGYCGAFVDMVVEKNKLARTPNGHGLSPLQALGGYNCRHTPVPVTRRIMETNGLSLAPDSAYVEAAAAAQRRS